MNTLISAYENYFIELRHLPTKVKKNTCELIFSYRNGVESICLFLSSLDSLTALVKNLPNDFFEEQYYRYAVDLSSIDTEIIRVYRDDKEYALKGYLINKNGIILEAKNYKKSLNKKESLIDRYDSQNTLISPNEKEIVAKEEEWKGSPLVPLIAKQNQFHVIYFKKETKDQCYARIRNI